jgi:hypothetical protein
MKHAIIVLRTPAKQQLRETSMPPPLCSAIPAWYIVAKDFVALEAAFIGIVAAGLAYFGVVLRMRFDRKIDDLRRNLRGDAVRAQIDDQISQILFCGEQYLLLYEADPSGAIREWKSRIKDEVARLVDQCKALEARCWPLVSDINTEAMKSVVVDLRKLEIWRSQFSAAVAIPTSGSSMEHTTTLGDKIAGYVAAGVAGARLIKPIA